MQKALKPAVVKLLGADAFDDRADGAPPDAEVQTAVCVVDVPRPRDLLSASMRVGAVTARGAATVLP
jgi:hypothetical protein